MTKMNEQKLLKEIQSLYMALNKVVTPLYEFKNCPKCGGNVMNIGCISPSGNSIEYLCDYCSEVMVDKVIPGMDPSKAIEIQNTIKEKMQKLYSLIGEEIHNRNIDIAFSIKS
jgi:hypothetical protein